MHVIAIDVRPFGLRRHVNEMKTITITIEEKKTAKTMTVFIVGVY